MALSRFLLACLLLILGVAALPALAADPAITITLPPDLPVETRDEVLKLLEATGAITVDQPVAAVGPTISEEIALALGEALAGAVHVGPLLAAWWSESGGWLTLLTIAGVLAPGLVGAWLVRRRRRPHAPETAELPNFRDRIGPATLSFLRDLAGMAIFAALSFSLWSLVPEPSDAARHTAGAVFDALLYALFLTSIIRLQLSPGAPEARLAPFLPHEVPRLWTVAMTIIWALVPIQILIALVGHGSNYTEVAKPDVLIAMFAGLFPLIARLLLFWEVRKPVAGLIEHHYGCGRGEEQPRLVAFFAANWHWMYMGLALVVFVVECLNLLLASRTTGPEGGAISMTLFILGPFIIGGIGAWFASSPKEVGGLASTGRALIQGLVALLIAVLIARDWGADPFDPTGDLPDQIASALLHAVFAVVIGWAVWQGVKAVLDHYAPESGDSGLDDESMGKTGSRIDTLIPVIRSTSFFVIAIIAGMTALTELGVNIAPLLAGAGVVGIAIGFGAQKIVADVITGIFYLIEDAFRVGEYIVTDEGKGVVEKISLRSVRLRHHRGPVYTIAFSSLGTVQNHSRDWVKIKFMLRVPFDADLEVVRKAIKGVGIELMEHPEYHDQFIQPVKSQGVMAVDDSGIVIGVKFLCKPGEQFVLRREAYARIKKVFAEKGIQFAPRRVIVDSEESSHAAHAGAAAAVAAHAGSMGREDGDLGMP